MKYKSTAICILGMHRSGTSCVTRAFNLLGAYLGEDANMMKSGLDNPEGFWEHAEIYTLQERWLAQLNRTWDTAAPLPDEWPESEPGRLFKSELKQLITARFENRPLWSWKDPRSCLLMPAWRSTLEELETRLLCVFVVRNPIDVSSSLNKRDPISIHKGLGIWFNYCITALRDTAGLPTVFLNYDRFLAAWESELRRCTSVLNLDWPADEQKLQETMKTFIRPDLHHNRAPSAQMQNLPKPIQELYQMLIEASTPGYIRDANFDMKINRLAGDFHAYASFFQNDGNQPVVKRPYLKRTWQRWQRSFRKRFSAKDKIIYPDQPENAVRG